MDEDSKQLSKNKKVLNAWAAREAASSLKINPNLGITEKYDRSLYENKTALQKYKNDFYGGKKTKCDPITGELMHRDHKAAQKKYGPKNYDKHASETDHKVSLKEGHERVRSNPFLKTFLVDNDVKKTLNDQKNFREIPRIINNTKKAQNDILYSLGIKKTTTSKGLKPGFKQFDNHMTPVQSVKFAANHVPGSIFVDVDLNITALKTANKEFITGANNALEAAAIPIMVGGVQNICQVVSGQKTLEEAGTDMGNMVASIGVSGGGAHLAAQVTNTLAPNVANRFLTHSNEIAQIVAVAALVKDSLLKLIDGEISGIDFFDEIGESGVGLLGNTLGGSIGSGLAAALLPATLAAGPAGVLIFSAGVACSIIVSTVCTEVYKYAVNLRKSYEAIDEIHEQKISLITNIANQAITELEKQQSILKTMMDEHFKEWDSHFDSGFQQIFSAIADNDFGYYSGLYFY